LLTKLSSIDVTAVQEGIAGLKRFVKYLDGAGGLVPPDQLTMSDQKRLPIVSDTYCLSAVVSKPSGRLNGIQARYNSFWTGQKRRRYVHYPV
jgi:hypothetical protein